MNLFSAVRGMNLFSAVRGMDLFSAVRGMNIFSAVRGMSCASLLVRFRRNNSREKACTRHAANGGKKIHAANGEKKAATVAGVRCTSSADYLLLYHKTTHPLRRPRG